MSLGRVVFVTLALALVGGLGWLAFGPREAPEQGMAMPSVMPAAIATAEARSVPIVREYVATSEAVERVEVRARATGYLLSRQFSEGDEVTAGQVLYRIDARDYEATRARAAAQVQMMRQTQGRQQQLAARGYAARATLDQANSNLRQAEADLRAAEIALDFTTIRAPIAGRIGHSAVDVGNLIATGDTLLTTIVQLDPLHAMARPAEADLPAIRAALGRGPVVAEFATPGGGPVLSGRVDFIGNEVDAATGTIPVRLTLDNPDKHVLPGQFGRARLHLGRQDAAVVVQQRSVGSDQIGRFVLVVGEGDILQRRDVTLGAEVGTDIVVAQGLAAGERYIADGLQKLRPGLQVTPLPPPGAEPGAAPPAS
ncbi:efflux RND transporter periplasmic adaptor subunit [Zavarzinia sp. CC-PAN008]|uniref:efflux RND transporter periplasmic adaptor subunit n=1 Tax=Zavarzinia sp. CC-PAN008 TaxID=3243332 RepID=UPI003F74A3DE